MRLNGITLTPETIQATRQWYADNAEACIAEAESGAVFVNDLPRYIAWRKESIVDALAGNYDHTLAFLQQAYFIQTGKSVPILS